MWRSVKQRSREAKSAAPPPPMLTTASGRTEAIVWSGDDIPPKHSYRAVEKSSTTIGLHQSRSHAESSAGDAANSFLSAARHTDSSSKASFSSWEDLGIEEAMRRTSIDNQSPLRCSSLRSSALTPQSGRKSNDHTSSSASSGIVSIDGELPDWLPELVGPSEILLDQTSSSSSSSTATTASVSSASRSFRDRSRFLIAIAPILPARAQGYPWQLGYSTAQHGFSLKTLYRRLAACRAEESTPIVVLVVLARDDRGEALFGALLSEPPHISEHFYGTGETSLFTFASDTFRHYRWSGDNSFFIKGSSEAFLVGAGQGKFGLWLDADLYHGRTQPCATFDNEPLVSGSGDFIVNSLEAWLVQ